MTGDNTGASPTRAEAARSRALLVLLAVGLMTLIIGCLAWVTWSGLQGSLVDNPALVCTGLGLPGAAPYRPDGGIHPLLAFRVLEADGAPTWTLDTAAVPDVWQARETGSLELVLCIEEAVPLSVPACGDPAAAVVYGFALPLRLVTAQAATTVAQTRLTSGERPEAACLDPVAMVVPTVRPERIWNWLTPYVVTPEQG